MIKLFDDIWSVLHLSLGIVASISHPLFLFTISLIFLVYEVLTSHSVGEIVSDTFEYGLGLLIGLLIRMLVKA